MASRIMQQSTDHHHRGPLLPLAPYDLNHAPVPPRRQGLLGNAPEGFLLRGEPDQSDRRPQQSASNQIARLSVSKISRQDMTVSTAVTEIKGNMEKQGTSKSTSCIGIEQKWQLCNALNPEQMQNGLTQRQLSNGLIQGQLPNGQTQGQASNGLTQIQLPNGQTQGQASNGLTQIQLPNGQTQGQASNGLTQIQLPNGQTQGQASNGLTQIQLPNGQTQGQASNCLTQMQLPNGLIQGQLSTNLTHGYLSNGLTPGQLTNGLTSEQLSNGLIEGQLSNDFIHGQLSKCLTQNQVSNGLTQGQLCNGSTQTQLSNSLTQGQRSNVLSPEKMSNGLTESLLSNGLTQGQMSDGLIQSQLSHSLTQSQLSNGLNQGQLTNGLSQLASGLTQSQMACGLTQSQLANGLTQSQLANGLTQSQLANGLTQSQLANGLTQSHLANSLAQSQLANGLTQSQLASGLTQDLGNDAQLLVVNSLLQNAITANISLSLQSKQAGIKRQNLLCQTMTDSAQKGHLCPTTEMSSHQAHTNLRNVLTNGVGQVAGSSPIVPPIIAGDTPILDQQQLLRLLELHQIIVQAQQRQQQLHQEQQQQRQQQEIQQQKQQQHQQQQGHNKLLMSSTQRPRKITLLPTPTGPPVTKTYPSGYCVKDGHHPLWIRGEKRRHRDSLDSHDNGSCHDQDAVHTANDVYCNKTSILTQSSTDGHQTLACQRRVPLLPGYNGTSADGQEQYDPAKPTGDQYDPAKPTDESDMNPFRCSNKRMKFELSDGGLHEDGLRAFGCGRDPDEDSRLARPDSTSSTSSSGHGSAASCHVPSVPCPGSNTNEAALLAAYLASNMYRHPNQTVTSPSFLPNVTGFGTNGSTCGTSVLSSSTTSGSDCGDPGSLDNPLHCHACNVECHNMQKFDCHMQSVGHVQRMREIMVVHAQQTGQQIARLKAQQHLRQIEARDRSGDFCRICDHNFHGSFVTHRRSEEHKRKERLSRRGCILCKTGSYQRYPEYVKHIDSPDHKQKKRALQIELDQRPGLSHIIQNGTLDGDGPDLDDMVTVDATGIFEQEMQSDGQACEVRLDNVPRSCAWELASTPSHKMNGHAGDTPGVTGAGLVRGARMPQGQQTDRKVASCATVRDDTTTLSASSSHGEMTKDSEGHCHQVSLTPQSIQMYGQRSGQRSSNVLTVTSPGNVTHPDPNYHATNCQR